MATRSSGHCLRNCQTTGLKQAGPLSVPIPSQNPPAGLSISFKEGESQFLEEHRTFLKSIGRRKLKKRRWRWKMGEAEQAYIPALAEGAPRTKSSRVYSKFEAILHYIRPCLKWLKTEQKTIKATSLVELEIWLLLETISLCPTPTDQKNPN